MCLLQFKDDDFMKNSKLILTASFLTGILPAVLYILYISGPEPAAVTFLILSLSFFGAFRIYSQSGGVSSQTVRNLMDENIQTLFNVKDQTEKMTLDMVDVMGKILKKTSEGSEEAAAIVDYFIGIHGKEKSSFGVSYISQMIKKNELVLQKAASLFGDISRVNGELLEKVQTSAQKIEGIYEFVSQINELALHTRILALNAMVEAVRAGGEYAGGFAVVADEVKKMADRSDQIASNIGTVAKESKEIMDSLRSEMQVRVREAVEGMENIEKDLIDTFGTLKTGIDNISEAIEVVTLNYQAIEKDIKGVIVALQYQDITSQQLNAVINDFSAFTENPEAIREKLEPEKINIPSQELQPSGTEKEKNLKKVHAPRESVYKESEDFDDDVTFF
jgi:hypothetical protein